MTRDHRLGDVPGLQDQIDRRRSLTPRQRGQLPAVFFAERPAGERLRDSREVALPVSPLQARAEAVRCLECCTSPCRQACPLGVDVPRFLLLAAEGDFAGAIRTIGQTSLLPAIAGRLCPIETYCQKDCTVSELHKDLGFAVSVGRIETFLADWARSEGVELAGVAPSTGMHVAVVGAGPAGLACAAELRRSGHDVTVYEALDEAGGFLIHGIPQFRLPPDVVRGQVESLAAMGVAFQFDTVIGPALSVDELLEEGSDAVFLAAGGGGPRFAGIPGEGLNGVFSALEYLTRVNAQSSPRGAGELPVLRRERVAVLGEGEMALDAARTALRSGAREVHVVARGSRRDVSAREEGLRHSEEEGVRLRFDEVPVEILGSETGWVRGLRVRRHRPGEGAAGREVGLEAGEIEDVPVDLVIEALGNGPNATLARATPGLRTGADGRVTVSAETLMTSRTGVFAGGDLVSEGANVVLAMAQGRQAALSIDAFLRSEDQRA